MDEKATKKKNKAKDLAGKFVKNNGAIVVFLIIFIFACLFIPRFARLANATTILKNAAIPIIGCIGMTCVLMTGGIDLSLGYTIGLTSCIVGLLITETSMPYALAIFLTLLAGAAIGMFNGFVVQKLRVPAFIATLGSGYIIYGIAQIISNGSAINHLPEDFLAIGKTKIGLINNAVIISLVICAIFYYVLHKSTFGRSLRAFGLSQPAAKLSGLNTSFINFMVYVISGLMASLVGVLITMDVNCAQPTQGGSAYTFVCITGAVLGGADLYGGVGSVFGAMFGMLTLKMINNCINLVNAPYYLGDAINGIVILLAIIFEKVKNRKM